MKPSAKKYFSPAAIASHDTGFRRTLVEVPGELCVCVLRVTCMSLCILHASCQPFTRATIAVALCALPLMSLHTYSHAHTA
jgi:hypothetical protein